MRIDFTKMHGCGNDYIYINCFERDIDQPESLAIALSDRHFGIGGDGIVLILRSDVADAKMRMFNIDGSEGKMCGNAIRCVAKYLYDNGMVKKNEIKIETLSGVKTLTLNTQNGLVSSVRVDMGKAELEPSKIPVAIPIENLEKEQNGQGNLVVNFPLSIEEKIFRITCVSMGNPHAVVFCEDVDTLKLNELGPLFENNGIFPERVNTEFVKVIDKNTLKMRVWERGSGETLACGTGACAAAVAAVLNGYCNKGEDIHVLLSGGELIINYTDKAVLMTGGCTRVFEGVVEI